MKESNYEVDAQTGASHQPYQVAKDHYAVSKGEYIGVGKGFNSDIVVKVKTKIESIEIIDEGETVGVGDLALDTLPDEIINQNSLDVDAISGATLTSQGIKSAIVDAIGNGLHFPKTHSRAHKQRPKEKRPWKDLTLEEQTQLMAAEIGGHRHS